MGKFLTRIVSPVGGGLLLGFAAGAFIAKDSPVSFFGLVLIGLGVGIIAAALISGGRNEKPLEEK